jgi:CheY-like chemotaxis protein
MEYIALIVDDDRPTLLFLEQVLHPTGIQVMQADNGLQALDILQSFTPVILFLDMLMPGASGIEVLEYIACTPRLNNMFVVVVSAHRYYEPSEALKRANNYLVKPIRPKDIRDITQHVLSLQAPH